MFFMDVIMGVCLVAWPCEPLNTSVGVGVVEGGGGQRL